MNRSTSHGGRRPFARNLRLEALEDRTLLSVSPTTSWEGTVILDDAGNLAAINPGQGSSGVASPRSLGRVAVAVNDVAFSPAGVLYGVDGGAQILPPAALYEIPIDDINNPPANIPANCLGRLEVDGETMALNGIEFHNQVLFGVGYDAGAWNAAEGAYDNWTYEIDPDTLTAERYVKLEVGGTLYDAAGGIEFDTTGNMYLTTIQGNLLKIDRGGASPSITSRGNTGYGGDSSFFALTFTTGTNRPLFGYRPQDTGPYTEVRWIHVADATTGHIENMAQPPVMIGASTLHLNFPPVAVDDNYQIRFDSVLPVPANQGMLANDTDPNGDSLTVIEVDTDGLVGELLAWYADGSFIYDPNGQFDSLAAGATATETFTYTVSDPGEATDEATVTITIRGNQAPIARNNSYTAMHDTLLSVPAVGVLSNDDDPDGDPITAHLVDPPLHGSVTLNPNGSLAYMPAAGYNGFDHFTYVANDGRDDSNEAIVSVRVLAPTPTGGTTTVGLFAPNQSEFLLRNSNDSGFADLDFVYGPSAAGWTPIAGDFDGDGTDTIGLYNPATARFLLRNSNDSGFADLDFPFGPAGAGWQPIVGDFNGDGIDTIGLYDPVTSQFALRNSNDAGAPNLTFIYGPGGAGWQPIVGDWDGNGTDTIGLYDPGRSAFLLRQSNNSGIADAEFAYGAAGTYYVPVVGDWDADAGETDTVGLYRPVTSMFLLRNSNDAGMADTEFVYGLVAAGWRPIVGDWDGGSPLRAAGGAAIAGGDATRLTQADLDPVVAEALARWESAGIAPDASAIDFVVADLPGSLLGLAGENAVYLDIDAAGHGWFIDPTPADDEEFARPDAGGDATALHPAVVDRMDLLTAVSHELGHVLGLQDLGNTSEGLMSSILGNGVRREPGAAEIDALLASI